MPYVPFYEYFPEIAEKETLVLIVFDDPELPLAEYGLVELFCDEPGCDCRRVFFNVISSKTKKLMAVIAYGWENKRFYEKWFGGRDPQIIKELKGPSLNLASMQSKLAPVLLNRVEHVLQDTNYVNRIKRHYEIFREAIEKQAIKNKKSEKLSTNLEIRPKVGRNDPCPCGLGKNLKNVVIINDVSPGPENKSFANHHGK